MLKRLIIWSLIFAVFIANFSMVLEYAGFKLNRQYISQNLCINRFKPSLHCNGRCYFMRKIKQAEENEKKQTSRSGSNRVEVSFLKEPFSFLFQEPAIIDQVSVSIHTLAYAYTSHYLDTVFRPPKSLS
ncbi:hypothetical protein [Mucilaginibacter sp.]